MDSLGFYKLHREPLQRIPRPGSVPQRNPPWRSCTFLHTETKAQVEKTPRFPLLKGRWYAVNVKLFISNKTRQQKNKKKSLHTTGCVVCHYLYFLPLHVTGTRLHPLCHTLQQYVHLRRCTYTLREEGRSVRRGLPRPATVSIVISIVSLCWLLPMTALGCPI